MGQVRCTIGIDAPEPNPVTGNQAKSLTKQLPAVAAMVKTKYVDGTFPKFGKGYSLKDTNIINPALPYNQA